MPLFFVLSAVAIYYALKKCTNVHFMRECVNRLRAGTADLLLFPHQPGEFFSPDCKSSNSKAPLRAGMKKMTEGGIIDWRP